MFSWGRSSASSRGWAPTQPHAVRACERKPGGGAPPNTCVFNHMPRRTQRGEIKKEKNTRRAHTHTHTIKIGSSLRLFFSGDGSDLDHRRRRSFPPFCLRITPSRPPARLFCCPRDSLPKNKTSPPHLYILADTPRTGIFCQGCASWSGACAAFTHHHTLADRTTSCKQKSEEARPPVLVGCVCVCGRRRSGETVFSPSSIPCLSLEHIAHTSHTHKPKRAACGAFCPAGAQSKRAFSWALLSPRLPSFLHAAHYPTYACIMQCIHLPPATPSTPPTPPQRTDACLLRAPRPSSSGGGPAAPTTHTHPPHFPPLRGHAPRRGGPPGGPVPGGRRQPHGAGEAPPGGVAAPDQALPGTCRDMDVRVSALLC